MSLALGMPREIIDRALGVDLIPYDAEMHGAFVYLSFVETMRETPPWCWGSPSQNRKVLSRVLRDHQCRAVVLAPKGHPDQVIGWAASINGALLFDHVRPELRAVIPELLAVNALDLDPPIPVAFWTRTHARRAAAGWHAFFDTRALEAVTRMAH